MLGSKGIKMGFGLLKLWAATFHILAFLPIRRKVSKNVKKNGSYIYVANHTSFLDATTVPTTVPGAVMPLGKKELLKVPFVGWVLARYAVFVDRSSKESRRKSVEKLIKKTRQGHSVFIFPEGTMNRTDQILQDFYKGAFRIAKETGLHIVPMVLHNGGKLLAPTTLALRPGFIDVEIGDPIPVEEYTVQELHDICRKWILDRLEAKQAS